MNPINVYSDICFKKHIQPQALVAHAFNPSTWEAEAGGSLWVWGQPGLQELVPDKFQCYRETLSWKSKANQTKLNKQTKHIHGHLKKARNVQTDWISKIQYMQRKQVPVTLRQTNNQSQISTEYLFKTVKVGSGEMAQWLKALAVFPGDLGLTRSTDRTVHNPLQLQSLGICCLLRVSVDTRHIHTLAKHT